MSNREANGEGTPEAQKGFKNPITAVADRVKAVRDSAGKWGFRLILLAVAFNLANFAWVNIRPPEGPVVRLPPRVNYAAEREARLRDSIAEFHSSPDYAVAFRMWQYRTGRGTLLLGEQ